MSKSKAPSQFFQEASPKKIPGLVLESHRLLNTTMLKAASQHLEMGPVYWYRRARNERNATQVEFVHGVA